MVAGFFFFSGDTAPQCRFVVAQGGNVPLVRSAAVVREMMACCYGCTRGRRTRALMEELLLQRWLTRSREELAVVVWWFCRWREAAAMVVRD